jgi:peptidoglycan hydrolase FlgJ
MADSTIAAAALAARTAYGTRPPGASAPRIDAAAQDFEAVFLTQMMERMFDGLSGEGPLGSGAAGGAYRSMLADQYGRTIAAVGGIGIAADIRRELIALQKGPSS